MEKTTPVLSFSYAVLEGKGVLKHIHVVIHVQP